MEDEKMWVVFEGSWPFHFVTYIKFMSERVEMSLENSQNTNNLASIVSHEMKTICDNCCDSSFEELTIVETNDWYSFNDIKLTSRSQSYIKSIGKEEQGHC